MGKTGSEVMVLEPNEELDRRLLGTLGVKVKEKKKLLLRIFKIYRNKDLSESKQEKNYNGKYSVLALFLTVIIFQSLLSAVSFQPKDLPIFQPGIL